MNNTSIRLGVAIIAICAPLLSSSCGSTSLAGTYNGNFSITGSTSNITSGTTTGQIVVTNGSGSAVTLSYVRSQATMTSPSLLLTASGTDTVNGTTSGSTLTITSTSVSDGYCGTANVTGTLTLSGSTLTGTITVTGTTTGGPCTATPLNMALSGMVN